jgi:hypothetical protein
MKPGKFLLGVALAACVLAGCSKSSSQGSGTAKSVNVGTVELTSGQPNRQDLGDGMACVFTAQPLGPGTFELVAVLEKSGKTIATTRKAPTQADVPLDLAFGETHVGVTPHLK